jgi:hypothetical protein
MSDGLFGGGRERVRVHERSETVKSVLVWYYSGSKKEGKEQSEKDHVYIRKMNQRSNLNPRTWWVFAFKVCW